MIKVKKHVLNDIQEYYDQISKFEHIKGYLKLNESLQLNIQLSINTVHCVLTHIHTNLLKWLGGESRVSSWHNLITKWRIP